MIIGVQFSFKMKLLPVFILLVVQFHNDVDATGDGPKIVYFCPGRDVYLKFNTSGPIRYSHFGGAKGGGVDANPLNMSVWILNNFKTEVNATAGNKAEFIGNLLAGHAWFKFKNFKPNDRDMILRISYKEFRTSPSKQDFKLILSKDCAQQKNSSVKRSINEPPSTGPNVTVTIVKPSVNIPTSINEPPSTGPNVPVTIDATGTPLSLIIVAAVVSALLVLFFVVMFWKGLSDEPQPHKNADNRSDDCKLEEGNQFPTDDNTTTYTLNESYEMNGNDDLTKNVLGEHEHASQL